MVGLFGRLQTLSFPWTRLFCLYNAFVVYTHIRILICTMISQKKKIGSYIEAIFFFSTSINKIGGQIKAT